MNIAHLSRYVASFLWRLCVVGLPLFFLRSRLSPVLPMPGLAGSRGYLDPFLVLACVCAGIWAAHKSRGVVVRPFGPGGAEVEMGRRWRLVFGALSGLCMGLLAGRVLLLSVALVLFAVLGVFVRATGADIAGLFLESTLKFDVPGFLVLCVTPFVVRVRGLRAGFVQLVAKGDVDDSK